MGNYSSALIPDTEEFESIVSLAEKLNEQVTHSMEAERNEHQCEEQDSSAPTQENSYEKRQIGAAPHAAELQSGPTQSTPTGGAQSLSSLLPKALSAVLQARPPSSLNSEPQRSRNPAAHTSPKLEDLQTELRELKEQFDQMKSQHNKEIKLLMNELDEEKRIRLTLQMEIHRMKKHMSK
ncbi:SH3 domain-containing kinase-binding protein 1 [Aulostomus maculatus]